MKNIVIVLMLIITISFLTGCNKDKKITQNNQENQEQKEEMTVEDPNNSFIYLVTVNDKTRDDITKLSKENSEQEEETLNLNCIDNLKKISLNKKLSPQETLKELFSYTDYNKQEIFNSFSNIENIKIEELILKNDFAILKLAKNNKFKNNNCIEYQIKKTLKQFDDIAGVDIYAGDVSLHEYIMEPIQNIEE